jgi:hypothetical protein
MLAKLSSGYSRASLAQIAATRAEMFLVELRRGVDVPRLGRGLLTDRLRTENLTALA